MNDSEEKESRISNLKDMRDKLSNTNQNSFDDEEFNEFENSSDEYEIVDAKDMINTLSEDYNKYSGEELTIDDEFIYKPSEDLDSNITPLKDDLEIDKKYIIEPKLENTDFPEEDENYSSNTFSFIHTNQEEYINEKFDDMMSKKVGNYSILAILGLIIGILLIIFAIFISFSASQRIIDSVTSGEVNTSVALLILLGVLFVILSIYKLVSIKSPFDNVIKSMKDVDKDTDSKLNKNDDVLIEQKTLANDNKKVKKIGEFDIRDIKEKIEHANNEITGESSEKELTEEEIEYEKAKLDNESIDEIFADMKEIEDVPIISIDSKEEEK